jgi:hypothetical protein
MQTCAREINYRVKLTHLHLKHKKTFELKLILSLMC